MSEENVEDRRLVQVMPEALANKIAAGEVVQRPASAEKELIENALDAGADDIEVVLKSAGSTLIQVRDNGCGMSPEDALECFRRHATSKIRTSEDLEQIWTLGFRGEALASIAAIAHVTLKTRRSVDTQGSMIRIHGGDLRVSEPCAAPPGTSIEVRNLFYNVPARRSFLKSPATEFKHLAEVFQTLALANPNVAFSLHHDGAELYRLAKSHRDGFEEALMERICALLGTEYAEMLAPVKETTSYLSARGFVGRPEHARRGRGEQFLFVNNRFVRSRSLSHAVFSAYEGLIHSRSYPFYALFLTLNPRHTDVNVHPTKAEIRFDDERGVYGFVKAVVRKALGTADLVPQFSPSTSSASTGQADSQTGPGWSAREVVAGEKPPGALTDLLYAPTERNEGERQETGMDAASVERANGAPLLWQLHNQFVLTQLRTGLMILDQRAAHERILYEQALESMHSGMGVSQQLLFPQTLQFGPSDFAVLEEIIPLLLSLGFSLDVFSGRTVVVRGVPADVRPGAENDILYDFLEDYKSGVQDLKISSRDSAARSVARRGAISAGAALSTIEMRTLIDRLFRCEKPYASPSGHPTMIRISMEELRQRFARRPS